MHQDQRSSTDRRLEHELQDALARYRAILASTLDPVVTIDDEGTIQDASDSVQRVFGWTPQELIGRNVSVLMPDPHRSGHDGYLARYRRTGRTSILGVTREFDAVRKDGTVFPVEISVSRADVPGGSRPLFTGIMRDVTHRRQSEQALQESEHRFRKILENVELAATMLDADGRIVFCNDYLLNLTGWARDEVLGKSWFDIFVPEDQRVAVRKVFRDGIDSGAVTPHYENDILTRSGQRRSIAWNNTILHDPRGTVTGVTGLGVDVTDQKQADAELGLYREHLEELVAERTGELEASHEQLRVADRLVSIGTLAAGLGHDMNNVLLPIRCRIDAMEVKSLPKDVATHFEEVRKSVQYLQQLADGLHLLSLDPDDAGPFNEETDLMVWWEQVGPLLGRGLPRHVRLATSWQSDMPPIAVAPHKLTQAVLNLVVNAGEAVGEHGKVRIWAKASGDRRTVQLGVMDNGHGMTPEVKRQALDPFFTTKKRGLGTGLGLSLVRGVALSTGGSVHIESEPDKGTAILLTLPAARPRRPGTPRTRSLPAAVSIGDRRIGSFIGTMLEAAGATTRLDESGGPGFARLWICDASGQTLDEARAFLARPEHRLVVLGPADEQWRRLGAVIIDDPTDFEEVRRRLHDIVSHLIGAPS